MTSLTNPAAAVPMIAAGDRCLYTGIGQLNGKQCDALWVHRQHASIRLDSGAATRCRSTDLCPVPRRPRPMF